MIFVSLLLSFQIGTPVAPPELEAAVCGYWDLLSRGDKNQALQYVAEPSRNAFIRRREPFFRSWELTAVQPVAPDRFIVTITAQCLRQWRFQDCNFTENWVREGEFWKVRLPNAPQALKRLWESPPKQPKRGILRILPRAVKVHFISPTRSSSIVIENGLDQAVEVIRIQHDSTRFQVVGNLHTVAPGEIGHIQVRYIGREHGKNLRSEIVLVTRFGDQERVDSIPIHYNLVSPGTRALLGLTAETAEQLRRTDELRPAENLPVQHKRGHAAGRDRRNGPNREPRR